ncbi:hypothetical protein NEOLI_004846 [Neolecta irregularis DAH-3]|uniref:Uncharacterized protein n=1 Tax=Neolecta irregularis (strain DAH-3) TaxID=1198029 RepID=A0A1U7LMD5_NEOID|nr:hypothetical protein NEOLI_004846 [Neolecta irregularis DAH-3]|eukprot:OLL23807.1 hypothetical protein NEOLI_004846 [Neolecta irregularis DAH-3]
MSPISAANYDITVPRYEEALAWLESENTSSSEEAEEHPTDTWSEAAQMSLEQAVRKLSAMEGRLGHARKISNGSLRPLHPIEELEESSESFIVSGKRQSPIHQKRNLSDRMDDPSTPTRSRSNSAHSLRHKRSREYVFPIHSSSSSSNNSDEDLLRAFPPPPFPLSLPDSPPFSTSPILPTFASRTSFPFSPPRQTIPPRKSSLAGMCGASSPTFLTRPPSSLPLPTVDDGYYSLPSTPAMHPECSPKMDCQCGSAVFSDLDPCLAARFVIRISSLTSLSKSSSSDKELARRKLEAALRALETTE